MMMRIVSNKSVVARGKGHGGRWSVGSWRGLEVRGTEWVPAEYSVLRMYCVPYRNQQ